MQKFFLSLGYFVTNKPNVDAEMIVMALDIEFLKLPFVKLTLVAKYSSSFEPIPMMLTVG
jgi:hypothetical protein